MEGHFLRETEKCKGPEEPLGNVGHLIRADKEAAPGILPRIPKLPLVMWPLATSYGDTER